MAIPSLKKVSVTGPAASHGGPRQIAWWDWNDTGQQNPNHVVVCVHGLTRQARDFDSLASALAHRARVVCVDVAGRGESDRLQDPMAYQIPTYASDLMQLLAHLQREHASAHNTLKIDWVGTSMGGLIGMAVAAQPAHIVRRLVLNDVGPVLQWAALQRIGQYLGQPRVFASQDDAVDYLWSVSSSFGPHSAEEWRRLSLPMLRPCPDGYTLHYDSAIALPFRALTGLTDEAAIANALAAAEAQMWALYDAIQAPTLLLRGAQSDLLTPQTAHEMTTRGPRARLVEFSGVGHAPTLVAADQLSVVLEFLH